MPHHRHSTLWGLHQKDEPPKHLALKGDLTLVQEARRAIRNRDHSVLRADLAAPGPSSNSSLKISLDFVNEIHLLILKVY